MTDPISDMLTRIRNAQLVKKEQIVLPFSDIKFRLAALLSKEGYLGAVQVLEPNEKKDRQRKELCVELKYTTDRKSSLRSIRRVSKPGLRIYTDKEHLPIVLSHKGIAILSTSQGLLTNKEAKKKGIGGEVLCEVY